VIEREKKTTTTTTNHQIQTFDDLKAIPKTVLFHNHKRHLPQMNHLSDMIVISPPIPDHLKKKRERDRETERILS